MKPSRRQQDVDGGLDADWIAKTDEAVQGFASVLQRYAAQQEGRTMETGRLVSETLKALDQMETEPTDFEANVLETCTRQALEGRLPSRKQCQVLSEMVEKYLHDGPLATVIAQAWEAEHARP